MLMHKWKCGECGADIFAMGAASLSVYVSEHYHTDHDREVEIDSEKLVHSPYYTAPPETPVVCPAYTQPYGLCERDADGLPRVLKGKDKKFLDELLVKW